MPLLISTRKTVALTRQVYCGVIGVSELKIFTIGFTKKSAETFFAKLKAAGVRRILDVRLNNISQLAGFSKRDDLEYFARELCQAGYKHMPELAPTKDILDNYKKHKGEWDDYEHKFLQLMAERRSKKLILSC